MALEPRDRPQSIQAWLSLLPDQPQVSRTTSPMPRWLSWMLGRLPAPNLAESSNLAESFLPPAEFTPGLEEDYKRLRQLLQLRKWVAADEKTAEMLLKIMNRAEKGWSNASRMVDFPCQDLQTIDNLWVSLSQGRFGFSVQQQIWESVGGSITADVETWAAFLYQVGWYECTDYFYGGFIFSLLIFILLSLPSKKVGYFPTAIRPDARILIGRLSDGAVLNLQEDVIQLRQKLVSAINAERSIRRKYDSSESAAREWLNRSRLARERGNEALAQHALARRNRSLEEMKYYEHLVNEQAQVHESLNQQLLDLEAQVDTAKGVFWAIIPLVQRLKACKTF